MYFLNRDSKTTVFRKRKKKKTIRREVPGKEGVGRKVGLVVMFDFSTSTCPFL